MNVVCVCVSMSEDNSDLLAGADVGRDLLSIIFNPPQPPKCGSGFSPCTTCSRDGAQVARHGGKHFSWLSHLTSPLTMTFISLVASFPGPSLVLYETLASLIPN